MSSTAVTRVGVGGATGRGARSGGGVGLGKRGVERAGFRAVAGGSVRGDRVLGLGFCCVLSDPRRGPTGDAASATCYFPVGAGSWGRLL